jgi:large subunit ribosomal protein L4
MPRKAVRAATRMAILSKFRDNEALILDDELKFETPKTSVMVELLDALKLADSKVLIGIPNWDKAIYLSARNLQNVMVDPVAQFNTYIVLRQSKLVLTRSAFEALRKSPEVQSSDTTNE